MKKKPSDYKLIRNLAMLSTVGIVLAACIFIGYFVGNYLDKKLGTEPYLMLVFLLLGIAAGFIQLFRTVSRVLKEK